VGLSNAVYVATSKTSPIDKKRHFLIFAQLCSRSVDAQFENTYSLAFFDVGA
jgi:hypothetical protein